jgi:hypothetical protein
MTLCDHDNDFSIIPLEDAERWGGIDGLVEIVDTGDQIVGDIPLQRLSDFCPLEVPPWSEAEGLTRSDVELALFNNDLNSEPYSSASKDSAAQWTTQMHAARIAYLVRFPSDEPIEIEFTEPGEAWMVLTDGWHRLAAAQYSGRNAISVSISGFVDHCVVGLGAICPSFQRLDTPPSLSI